MININRIFCCRRMSFISQHFMTLVCLATMRAHFLSQGGLYKERPPIFGFFIPCPLSIHSRLPPPKKGLELMSLLDWISSYEYV